MRTRHQAGSVQKRQHGKKKVWVGLYRDVKGSRRYKTLKGAKTESQAKIALAEILLPINRERAVAEMSAEMKLADYVDGVYIPFGRRKWKASTATTTEQRLQQHIIKGELGQVKVGTLSRDILQSFLERRGTQSFSVVNHLRWDLKAICRLAIQDGLLERDPASSLFTPGTTTTKPREFMTREQVVIAINALDLRERIFCRFALYSGMRPGEIVGLRWTDIDGAVAKISRRVYYGVIDTPKGRKGKDTSREAALAPSLAIDLETWRQFAISADAYVFPTEKGTPIQYSNLMEDFIRPALKKVDLGWVNFQVMRRTWSNLSKEAGVDAKVSADQLGHSVKVDMSEYTKSSAAQKDEAVRKFESYVQ